MRRVTESERNCKMLCFCLKKVKSELLLAGEVEKSSPENVVADFFFLLYMSIPVPLLLPCAPTNPLSHPLSAPQGASLEARKGNKTNFPQSLYILMFT